MSKLTEALRVAGANISAEPKSFSWGKYQHCSMGHLMQAATGKCAALVFKDYFDAGREMALFGRRGQTGNWTAFVTCLFDLGEALDSMPHCARMHRAVVDLGLTPALVEAIETMTCEEAATMANINMDTVLHDNPCVRPMVYFEQPANAAAYLVALADVLDSGYTVVGRLEAWKTKCEEAAEQGRKVHKELEAYFGSANYRFYSPESNDEVTRLGRRILQRMLDGSGMDLEALLANTDEIPVH